MSVRFAYVGYTNTDGTEGRGVAHASSVALVLDKFAELLSRMAGYTGADGYLVPVNPDMDVVAATRSLPDLAHEIYGYWTDELGSSRYGLLPAVKPERWPAEKAARFHELARKFPDQVKVDARALLHQTLPTPSLLRHGTYRLFLLVEDATHHTGGSSRAEYLPRVIAVYDDEDLAVAGMQARRAANVKAGRQHVVAVDVDLDGTPARPIALRWLPGLVELDEHAQRVNERENSGVRVAVSETTAEANPVDPDLEEFQALLGEYAAGQRKLTFVGMQVSSRSATSLYVLPAGTHWDKVDGDWTVVQDAR
ncbi:hypothetical protein [Cellulosimicrobium sp. Marseille-Q4280]|uniref:hypothetical protein n=1 Tax=Cellulosimicrobium sp. Marseille-Q4280 TaxID=2937992 RepID=UPI002041ECB8|nr:hypothetical protein [Cellulosimicrobium sp. Marseille-Q4280]